MADWIENLDPVTGYFADDHYRQLRRNIDAIIKKITTLDCYRRAKTRPQIVSVGHSLGGGLAQLAALANNPARPRIAKIFAFDPSPITGASYVQKAVLAQNAEGLEIDRIYQSGEVLQGLRKYYQQFPKDSSACVRRVVFDFFRPDGPVRLHTMSGLAREMVKSTYVGDAQYSYELPAALPGCRTRYQPPPTDQDYDTAPAIAGPTPTNRAVTFNDLAWPQREAAGARASMLGLNFTSRDSGKTGHRLVPLPRRQAAKDARTPNAMTGRDLARGRVSAAPVYRAASGRTG